MTLTGGAVAVVVGTDETVGARIQNVVEGAVDAVRAGVDHVQDLELDGGADGDAGEREDRIIAGRVVELIGGQIKKT